MSTKPPLSTVLLDTLLARLAVLFLTAANGDLNAARQAARELLLAYRPETPDELTLAAEIIIFSFHAMEALNLAATAGMPLTKILRLRGSAVSLSRESHKSQRKLDQLQKARRTGTPAPQPDATPRPKIDNALALIETTRQAVECPNDGPVKTPVKAPGQTWTQGYQQRQAAKRIAANLKRNQALQAIEAPPAALMDESMIRATGTVNHPSGQ